MRAVWTLLFVLGVAAMSIAPAVAADVKDKKGEGRVFEIRTYHAAKGKMDALHARFRDHTCKLFKKHGMELIGFWVPTKPQDAEQRMVYILAFPSKEAADKAWQAFRDDPVWNKAKTESEKDGKLVDKVESEFLKATDYSPVK